jgi:hypothetical protein
MAVTFYNTVKHKLATAALNMSSATIKAILVENDGFAVADATAIEHDFLGDFDSGGGIASHEFDGANYVRTTLASQTVTENATTDKTHFDADDFTISSLGAGTNGIAGVLLYVHVTNDTDSYPVAYLPYGTVQVPDGSDFTVTWSSNGIIRIA